MPHFHPDEWRTGVVLSGVYFSRSRVRVSAAHQNYSASRDEGENSVEWLPTVNISEFFLAFISPSRNDSSLDSDFERSLIKRIRILYCFAIVPKLIDAEVVS